MTAEPAAVAVERTIRRMLDAYRRRSRRGVLAAFAPDPNVAFISIGHDEIRVGPDAIGDQLDRDWAQTDSIDISGTVRNITASGTTAWALVDGAFHIRAGCLVFDTPARISVVLVQHDGAWLIVQAHFSTPAASLGEPL